jgi:PLP dependent protein
VRDLLPVGALIHGLDSLRLAEEIEKRAAEAGLSPVGVLLEVNISGEEQKYGLWPDEIEEVVGQLAELTHVDVRGLMTMAPQGAETEEARAVFRGLRELRDRINAAGVYPRRLEELSMGMSQDYAVAVEEGATLVRVGTAIFE